MDWDTNIKDVYAENSVDAVSNTVETVFEQLGIFGPESISFLDFTVDSVSAQHLAAALRVCSSISTKVAGWNHGLKVAYAASLKQGLDPEDVLYGMLEHLD